MKLHLRNLVGVAVLLAAISVHAQTANRAKVSVPFSFVVGRTVAPAGNYQVSISEARDLVTISNRRSVQHILMTTRGPQLDSRQSRLSFCRVGGQWVLQEIAIGGVALVVSPAASEKELAKESSDQQTLAADLRAR
jgi:hypothetical protein